MLYLIENEPNAIKIGYNDLCFTDKKFQLKMIHDSTQVKPDSWALKTVKT